MSMSSTSDAIRAVQEVLPHAIALPGSKDYTELSESYFSQLQREVQPACFVTPSSALEVATIIKGIGPFGGPGTLTLAICGAGQQATAGGGNVVSGGITVHLRDLKGIEIDRERGVVSVAAGERMGGVYEKLAAAGLAVVGNRHSGAGIGEDALQGGLSYFSYERGFVCDNVVNYEIVLASGDIVNANRETNPDLWVALKGSGNNFGIVTRFDLRVFPRQGKMWGGKVFYTETSFSGQIQSLVDYLRSPDPDAQVYVRLRLGYMAEPIDELIAVNEIYCTRPVDKAPEALAPFADVDSQNENTLRRGTVEDFADEGVCGLPSRVVEMSTSLRANAAILDYATETFRVALEQLRGIESLLISITFEPIPISLMERSIALGGNSLGLDPSHGPLVVVLLCAHWEKAGDDRRVQEVIRAALDVVNAQAREDGVFSDFVYPNYASSSRRSYRPRRKEFLKAISQKYDPEGWFLQTFGVGP